MIFVNAMDLAEVVVPFGICLNYRLYFRRSLERGLCGLIFRKAADRAQLK